jgi:hypothetical protein
VRGIASCSSAATHNHNRPGACRPALRLCPPRLRSVCSASTTAFGFLAATRRSASAGPSGVRLPCSQLRSVATLTPIMRAKCVWDAPSLALTARTSAGRNAVIRDGFSVPRRIRPACRTPVSSSSKAVCFIFNSSRTGRPRHVRLSRSKSPWRGREHRRPDEPHV